MKDKDKKMRTKGLELRTTSNGRGGGVAEEARETKGREISWRHRRTKSYACASKLDYDLGKIVLATNKTTWKDNSSEQNSEKKFEGCVMSVTGT